MPLRDVGAINARLDAVQDLMAHPTFADDFSKLVKGVPDLERIISRIHAKSCKVKDFLKVLNVSAARSFIGDLGANRRLSSPVIVGLVSRLGS